MLSPDPVLFELKYCERCGGLWLRPQGGDAIYCCACSQLMRELPPLDLPRRRTAPSDAASLAVVSEHVQEEKKHSTTVILSKDAAVSAPGRGPQHAPVLRGMGCFGAHAASASKEPYSNETLHTAAILGEIEAFSGRKRSGGEVLA